MQKKLEEEKQSKKAVLLTGQLNLSKMIDKGCTTLVFDCPPMTFSNDNLGYKNEPL